jgi:F-type H+-transporting ATPase subunit epsilon
MSTFPLKITSPEGDLFSGDAVMLSVRSTEGELAIMAGHIPFVCSVKPCDCKVELEDGEQRIGHVDGGILTVLPEKVVLLSGSFSWKE